MEQAGAPQRVQLLDGVRVGGTEVTGTRLRALLIALVLARGRPVTTGALVDAVWDGDAPSAPAGALQALVSRVRRTTGVPVEAVSGGYRVPAASVVVDVVEAEDALRRARGALSAGRAREAAQLARAGLAGWDAEPGDHLPPASAARLAGVRRDLVLLRADATAAEADPPERAEVLAQLEEAATAAPLDEPLAAAVVTALVADGRPALALARFEQVRQELAGYGSDPSAALRAAHARALAASVAPADEPVSKSPAPESRAPEFPAPAPPGPAGARVPEGLLGRADDLTALLARVDAGVLVTVVGPGGVGKTSLLTALVQHWRERGEPVHDVALAGVRAGEDVLPVVLAALGGGRRAERGALAATSPEAELRRVVAGTRGLLVLDNCEHLLDAVADVALQVCAVAPPALRVVATSRAPLGVLGEQVQPLAPLADQDAVALVLRRVRAVRPDAAVRPEEVAELCRRLDNLPLALELAAARLRTMTPADLLAGLDDRFALLAAGPRGLPERHRSLQALVDWSWDLLQTPQQVLLRRLAVFPAGATTEAVLAVCADGDLPAAGVRAALAGLVDASLVVLEGGDARGPGRYRLLETVRQYADARAGDGERDAVGCRFAQWAVRRARHLGPRLNGREQAGALQEAALERDAFASALRWAASTGRGDLATPIAAVLVDVATRRSNHAEVLEWARVLEGVPSVLRADRGPRAASAAGTAGADLPARWREAATLAVHLALNGFVLGQVRVLARAVTQLRAALTHPELLGDGLGAAAALVVALAHEDAPGQRAAADRLVASSSPWWSACGLLGRAWLQENSGVGDLGLADARAAHARMSEIGDLAGRTTAASFVGQRLLGAGRVTEAATWWQDAEEAATAIGADADARQARLLSLRAQVLSAPQRAAAVDEELAALARAHPDDDAVRFAAATSVAERAQAAGDWAAARAALAGVLADLEASATTVPQARAFVLASAAVVEARAGQPGACAQLLARAVGHAVSSRDVPAQAVVGDALAVWCALTGRVADARRLWALSQRFESHLHHVVGAPVPPELAAVLGAQEPGGAAGTAEAREVAALGDAAAVALLQELLAHALRR